MEPEDSNADTRAFAEMAMRLRLRGSARRTLDEIVALAVEMIDGCDEAGVTLVLRRNTRRWVETASTTRRARRTRGHAPVRAERGTVPDGNLGPPHRPTEDMAHEARWPNYAPAAAQLGVASALAFQLFIEETTLGALNLYSRRRYAFDTTGREIGTVLAAQAAVALAGAQTEAQLREAIRTRQIIGQAIGILMERRRITSQEAFDLLRRASQSQNVKLRDLAEYTVRTGKAPTGSHRNRGCGGTAPRHRHIRVGAEPFLEAGG